MVLFFLIIALQGTCKYLFSLFWISVQEESVQEDLSIFVVYEYGVHVPVRLSSMTGGLSKRHHE